MFFVEPKPKPSGVRSGKSDFLFAQFSAKGNIARRHRAAWFCDDFRKIEIWADETVEKRRYWAKDVGREVRLLHPLRPNGY